MIAGKKDRTLNTASFAGKQKQKKKRKRQKEWMKKTLLLLSVVIGLDSFKQEKGKESGVGEGGEEKGWSVAFAHKKRTKGVNTHNTQREGGRTHAHTHTRTHARTHT